MQPRRTPPGSTGREGPRTPAESPALAYAEERGAAVLVFDESRAVGVALSFHRSSSEAGANDGVPGERSSCSATGTWLTRDIAARTGYTGAQAPVQLQASGPAFGSALTSPAQLA
jgi:hypothetical protein